MPGLTASEPLGTVDTGHTTVTLTLASAQLRDILQDRFLGTVAHFRTGSTLQYTNLERKSIKL